MSNKRGAFQKGHKGNCLNVTSQPDKIEKHYHPDCAVCPHREQCTEKACVKETRHVIDTVVQVKITAHKKMCVQECLFCGQPKTGEFPADIANRVQYGKNLEALVVSLNTVGAVSINRIHEIIGSVFDIPLATGTIKNMVTRCAEKIKPVLKKIRQAVIKSPVVNCDETGTRVEGKTQWAQKLKKLLLNMKKARDRAVRKEKAALSPATVHRYSKKYDELILYALSENTMPKQENGKRGKKRKGKVLSLIDRLLKYKGQNPAKPSFIF